MARANTLTQTEIAQLLSPIITRKYATQNRSMKLLNQWAGLWIGDVAGLLWSDVTTTAGLVKDEIRLLPDMTKGRHTRTVLVCAKLKAKLQAYAGQATYKYRSYQFFPSLKCIKLGFNANSLVQTLAQIHEGVDLEGASIHSGRRKF